MNELKNPLDPKYELFSAYRGKWVALIGDKVVGHGATKREAQRASAVNRRREKPLFRFIPPLPILDLPPYFFEIQKHIHQPNQVYLVGGAIRDMLLEQPVHDLDFVVKENVQSLARKVANALDGAYYQMHAEYDIGRVIFEWDGIRQVADFVKMQGETIEEDLKKRDFTINAISIDVCEPSYLIDIHNSVRDLREKELHLCTSQALTDDPVRVLRAIRCAIRYELRIIPETAKAIKAAKTQLLNSSHERIRDEFFKILQLSKVKPAHMLMEHFDLYSYLFKDFILPFDHIAQFEAMDQILNLFNPTAGLVNRLQIGMIYTVLHPYLSVIKDSILSKTVEERSQRELLYFAILINPNQLSEVSNHFRLSNDEQLILRKILNNFEKVHSLEMTNAKTIALMSYRFYREVNNIGFLTLYFAIMKMIVSQGKQPNIKEIQLFLEKCDALLNAWINQYDQIIDPPQIIDGRLLMRKLRIKPGPQVGIIIESIREAQVCGEIETENDAIKHGLRQIAK